MIALIVIGVILITLIALFITMAHTNSGKSRDARKATWS